MPAASKLTVLLPKAFFSKTFHARIHPPCSREFHHHGSSSSSSSSLLTCRSAHNASAKDAEGESAEALRPGVAPVLPDEVIEVRSTVSTVVPDGVSQAKSGVVTVVQQTDVDVSAGAGVHDKTDKYWAPDPETGVFAPEERQSEADHGGLKATPHPTGNGSSVLEQTAWFRHVELEEVDRPHPVLGADVV